MSTKFYLRTWNKVGLALSMYNVNLKNCFRTKNGLRKRKFYCFKNLHHFDKKKCCRRLNCVKPCCYLSFEKFKKLLMQGKTFLPLTAGPIWYLCCWTNGPVARMHSKDDKNSDKSWESWRVKISLTAIKTGKTDI